VSNPSLAASSLSGIRHSSTRKKKEKRLNNKRKDDQEWRVPNREKSRNKKERKRYKNARGLFSSPSWIVRGFWRSLFYLFGSIETWKKPVAVYASLILSFPIRDDDRWRISNMIYLTSWILFLSFIKQWYLLLVWEAIMIMDIGLFCLFIIC
jgi:hypothetical protein